MKQWIALSLCLALLCGLLCACGGETPSEERTSAAVSSEESLAETSSAAEGTSTTAEEPAQKIPPVFLGVENGALSPLSHAAGEGLDPLADVQARDDLTPDDQLVFAVSEDGGYDPELPGVYTLTITVTDEHGNVATATRKITVTEAISRLLLVLGDETVPYVRNQSGALAYTSSGTAFRSHDVIQVMDKDFFLKEYNESKAAHTNNGGVPFLPYGVILVTDAEMNLVQARLAAGACIQIEQDGSLSHTVSWNSQLDATEGGGMFKNFVTELEQLLPGDGYVLFVGNPGEQLCRLFLIHNLFRSDYTGGALGEADRDVDYAGVRLLLK